MSYETSRESSAGLRILTGFALGAAVCSILVGVTNNTDARVKGVQINNEQLDAQLSRAHAVHSLILDDNNHKFTFQTAAQNGQPETCAGSYAVHDDIARVTGDLACTQIVAVAQR